MSCKMWYIMITEYVVLKSFRFGEMADTDRYLHAVCCVVCLLQGSLEFAIPTQLMVEALEETGLGNFGWV